MTITTLTETNFSVFRLMQSGGIYWLQKFDGAGLEQMDMTEQELRTVLAALPPRLLVDALDLSCPGVETHLDNNPFFHLGDQ